MTPRTHGQTGPDDHQDDDRAHRRPQILRHPAARLAHDRRHAPGQRQGHEPPSDQTGQPTQRDAGRQARIAERQQRQDDRARQLEDDLLAAAVDDVKAGALEVGHDRHEEADRQRRRESRLADGAGQREDDTGDAERAEGQEDDRSLSRAA